MKRYLRKIILIGLSLMVGFQPLRAVEFSHPTSPDPLPLYPPVPWNADIPSGLSQFTVNIVADRTSGVGPLYVFFDATAVLPAADGYADMEATYLWSFDTTGVDSYAKYDRVSGFVAGHVFNLAGTYTVRLDVFDKAGRHGYGTTQITVSDFIGTTYYVALTGDDTNNDGKSTTTPFKTPAYAFNKAATNTRILFRNGDVFNVTGTDMTISGNGPVIISGYSDPSHPSSVVPELHTDARGEGDILTYGENADDWRIVGLKMTTNGHTYGKTNGYPGGILIQGTHLFVSHCEFYNMGDTAINIWGGGRELHLRVRDASVVQLWNLRSSEYLSPYSSRPK